MADKIKPVTSKEIQPAIEAIDRLRDELRKHLAEGIPLVHAAGHLNMAAAKLDEHLGELARAAAVAADAALAAATAPTDT